MKWIEKISTIKREEREEWHKGGRVSDCEKGENAIHFWATVSTAKRAHFLCEILRESSKKSISIHIRLIQKKKFTHIIKIMIIWLEESLKTQF